LQSGAIADITLPGEDPAVQGLDLFDGLGQVFRGRHRVRDGGDLGTEVHGNDVGAFLGQADRVTAPLPACGTRDEGDLTFEFSHLAALPLRSNGVVGVVARCA
jgi:hypothetical protein